MKFHCDSASVTGYDHIVKCDRGQDYCKAGVDNHFGGDIAYAIVSDGCSSGGDTDIGSRLLCITARSFFKKNSSRSEFNPKSFLNYLSFNCSGQERDLELDRSDMFATCVVARVDKDFVEVLVLGDGIVVFQFESGAWILVKYEWSENAPLYPVYKEGDIQSLAKNTGLTLTRHRISTAGLVEETTYDHTNYLDGAFLSLPTQGLLNVGVFTDGLLQVKSPEGGAMEWVQVAKDLMGFKGYGGVFAKRRLNNFFLAEAKKYGYIPYDDLSYSVIHIIKEEQDGK